MSRHRNVRNMNLDDEMYDDYDDYEEEQDYEDFEDFEEDTVQVAYDPSLHKPKIIESKINQIKQIIPKSDKEIKKALDEQGGSVERAIDSLLQGKDLLLFFEKEAKYSLVLPLYKRFAPLKDRKFVGVERREMQVDIPTVGEETRIKLSSLSLKPKQSTPVSLGSLASSTTKLSLSSLKTKTTTKQGQLSTVSTPKQGQLSSLSLNSIKSTPKQGQLSSLSKSIKSVSKPTLTLSQLHQSKTMDLPQTSTTQTSTKVLGEPTKHGLFLSSIRSPPPLSIQLTFLDTTTNTKPNSDTNRGKPKSLTELKGKSKTVESLVDDVEGMNIVPSVTTTPKQQKKRINVKEEYEKRNTQPRLNLVVVGHVDAGKSTMMGHLLLLLGETTDRQIQKFKKEAEQLKKTSFCYAWVLDSTLDERERGVTIDVGVNQFKTKKRVFTLLDAPGHKDFIPNMISGTSQADVAILVVDASTSGFESGFDEKGQTREHALLLKSLGVDQVLVVVNKMDMCDWAQDRFDYIQQVLGSYLESIGLNGLRFVPVSGFTGDNLKAPVKSKWYKGPTLVEALDSFDLPTRDIDEPFSLSVQDYFKGGVGPSGAGSVTVCGRIASGNIQVGDKVLAMPINQTGTIKAIQVGEDDASWAVAGDRVSVSINGLDIIQIHLGTVLCDPFKPVPVASQFRAQISTFELDIPLTIGVAVVMHHLGTSESARIITLESVKTEKGDRKFPRSLGRNQTATVIIQLERPVCLQTVKDSKELSRFLLRRGNDSVAAGTVLNLQ